MRILIRRQHFSERNDSWLPSLKFDVRSKIRLPSIDANLLVEHDRLKFRGAAAPLTTRCRAIERQMKECWKRTSIYTCHSSRYDLIFPAEQSLQEDRIMTAHSIIAAASLTTFTNYIPAHSMEPSQRPPSIRSRTTAAR